LRRDTIIVELTGTSLLEKRVIVSPAVKKYVPVSITKSSEADDIRAEPFDLISTLTSLPVVDALEDDEMA
jgi:hypothetical protein